MSDLFINILVIVALAACAVVIVITIADYINDLDYRARMVEYAKCADWADFDKIRELDADEKY